MAVIIKLVGTPASAPSSAGPSAVECALAVPGMMVTSSARKLPSLSLMTSRPVPEPTGVKVMRYRLASSPHTPLTSETTSTSILECFDSGVPGHSALAPSSQTSSYLSVPVMTWSSADTSGLPHKSRSATWRPTSAPATREVRSTPASQVISAAVGSATSPARVGAEPAWNAMPSPRVASTAELSFISAWTTPPKPSLNVMVTAMSAVGHSMSSSVFGLTELERMTMSSIAPLKPAPTTKGEALSSGSRLSTNWSSTSTPPESW
mmetsp:Transcript_3305/g.11877  ORF Transcript_3305/g.11877 Transcript_3305/m.11877 type:complete len:264 (-) Transcript_3305:2538-3329(-)